MTTVTYPEPTGVLLRSQVWTFRVGEQGRNCKEKDAYTRRLILFNLLRQISRITGMIKGRRLVLFWMYRFRSLRIFSLITP